MGFAIDRGYLAMNRNALMFRFMIRDLLWLMVVAALGMMLWIEQHSVRTERASLARQRASHERDVVSQRASLNKEWEFLMKAAQFKEKGRYELRLERERFLAEQVPEEERERAKQRSAELGAPQPRPLPPGYGENP
jgi:hypothetical protein